MPPGAGLCGTGGSLRTYQRWAREGGTGIAEGPLDAPHATLASELSDPNWAHILTLINSTEFACQQSSLIMPTLVDRGDYVASESTLSG